MTHSEQLFMVLLSAWEESPLWELTIPPPKFEDAILASIVRLIGG